MTDADGPCFGCVGFDSPGDIPKQNVPHDWPTREGRESIYSQAPVLHWSRVSQLLINSFAFSSWHFRVDTCTKITVQVPPDPMRWIPWKPWSRRRNTWRKQVKLWPSGHTCMHLVATAMAIVERCTHGHKKCLLRGHKRQHVVRLKFYPVRCTVSSEPVNKCAVALHLEAGRKGNVEWQFCSIQSTIKRWSSCLCDSEHRSSQILLPKGGMLPPEDMKIVPLGCKLRLPFANLGLSCH